MSILIAGGAGYIGSHMVDSLVNQGKDVVVIDNLSTGHKQAINSLAKFYFGDTRNKEFLRDVFEKENIEAVVHFDAFSLVPESVVKPLKYFDDNLVGIITLLEVMKEYDCEKIVFSSSAATYGIPDKNPIKEDFPLKPINPYGDTKVMMEKIMQWCNKAYGLKWVALRYFNAAGAKEDGSLGEDHRPETHLIPRILQVALEQRDHIDIYGNDYNTPDGTNVRDYVHVLDLVDAHVLALNYLNDGKESRSFNLGSSTGFSVKEIVETARKVTGKKIPAKIAARRGGDPDSLVADSTDARKLLGWKPKYDDVYKIIETAWIWSKKHPNGFDE